MPHPWDPTWFEVHYSLIKGYGDFWGALREELRPRQVDRLRQQVLQDLCCRGFPLRVLSLQPRLPLTGCGGLLGGPGYLELWLHNCGYKPVTRPLPRATQVTAGISVEFEPSCKAVVRTLDLQVDVRDLCCELQC